MTTIELSLTILWAGVVIGFATYAWCAWRESR